MIIIGHRGAKGLSSENSLESIQVGINLKSDMIEVDLRIQGKDIVLSHDVTFKTKKYCSLHDALRLVGGSVPLILEIKEIEVAALLPEAIQGYKGHLIFSSQRFSILEELKLLIPGCELAIIEKWSGVRAVAEASLLGTQNIHISHKWIWGGFVRSMKHRGYKLFAYTVNSKERAEELESWGVDGIFTDYPDRFTK